MTSQNGASFTEAASGEEREWSELLPDILHLVTKRLPDLCDFVRFRAVCKNWHSELPLSDPPPQLPWLLSRSTATKNQLEFYSLSHDKFLTMSVPESDGKELTGPSQNYIFASNPGCTSLTLFNPLTRKKLPLPTIDLDWCFPICTASNGTEHVAICGGKTESKIQTLGFCCPGSDKWTTIRKTLEGCLMMYHKGMYFVYSPETGATEVVEATSGTVVTLIPPPPTKLNCFIESCGEILGISCNRILHGSLDQDGDCTIYRVEYEGEICKWVDVGNIGDRILFLDGGNGFSISTSGFNKSERNCIFYLGSQDSINFDGASTTYFLCRYEIGARIWQKLSLPSLVKPNWFLPSHQ